MIQLRQIAFDAQAEQHLTRITALGPRDVLWFGLQVDAGNAACFSVDQEGKRIGSLIVTEDLDVPAPALVVNAYAADPGHGDTLRQVLDELDDLARSRGLRAVRFFTRLEALSRRARAYGFSTDFMMERAI